MSSLENLITELETPSNISVILATVWIIKEAISSTNISGPTLIGQYADTKSIHTQHNDIIDRILMQTPASPILLEADFSYDIQNYLANDKKQISKKLKAIWFVDSLNSFMRLQNDLLNETNYFQRNGYFCIIYTGQERNRLEVLRSIFNRLFRIYVINVNILLPSVPTVLVYTYFPFTKTACHSDEPIYNGFFGPITKFKYSHQIFFPKKLSNMWGCPVNVTSWEAGYLMHIKFDNETGDMIRLGGIEGKLLSLLAKHTNFRIQGVPVDEEIKQFGKEGIKMLYEGITNITLGYMMVTKEREEITHASIPYLQVPSYIAISIGRMLTPLERLTYPFNHIVWICLSLSLLFGIFVIYLLKAFFKGSVHDSVFGQGNIMPFTNLWSIFYGGSTTGPAPNTYFARLLLGLWLLFTLILRTAYLAQLFIIMQDSRAHTEFNTIEEIVAQDFTFYTNKVLLPILTGTTTKKIKIKTIEGLSMDNTQLTDLLFADENAKIAITMARPFIAEHNQNPKNYNRQLNILREPLAVVPIVLYMRKHSYLADEIDSTILNLMSMGLIKHFDDNAFNNPTYLRENEKTSGYITLPLLTGLFGVHFFLLMLCTLVFLLELWSKSSPRTKKFLDFYNY